ncbi:MULTISPECIES: LuxR family transcriptional regulator [Micromonospora]|uniref:AAA family ATPase n=1 Tax=Micromonospora zamorensis TaxID=709883 RepID=A0ABZ1PMB9_9ACTN|nr:MULTISPECIES: LuxR family transcriptional regulator [Micromonospora]MBQ1037240.1 AAA family ATPase [Micromonospora sp. C81]WSK48167.1 AAA family ATPase [Micromonospora zamorensis]
MGLVERDKAVAGLEGLLTEAVAGRGRVAMITGTVGTGKSELLHTLADRAVDFGALAVTASGAHAERNLPLALLSQLFHDAPLQDRERERAMSLLHEGTVAALAADNRDDNEHIDVQIVHGLCTILLELAERYPLALLVDDVHQADRASVVCLAYLARRARFAPVLVAFTQTEFGRSAEPSWQAELLRPGHGSRVKLTPLTGLGVQQFAAETVGAEVAERLAGQWYQLTGGNPLLVSGLLEDYQTATEETGAAPDEVVVGERYAQAVVSCLRRGDPQLLEVARGVAVLADTEALDRLLRTDAGVVAQAMRALTTAGIFTLGGFRHPVAAAAVLAGFDQDERAELHRRAAVLAYDGGASARVVAEHLLCAKEASEAWGVAALEDAARQALREGQVESAVSYLKLAWRACTDERQKIKIMTTLVRAEWRVNPSSSSSYLPELAGALDKGFLQGSDAVILAKALLWHGQLAEAEVILEHLAATGVDLDPAAAGELAMTRPWLRCSYAPLAQHFRPAPVTVSTVSASRRLEAANALSTVLSATPSESVAGVVERILRSSRLDEMSLDTVESALLTLTYGGHAEQAAPWCDLFIEEAHTRRAPSRQARLSAIRAEVALRLGDLPGAARHARLALEIMPPSSWGVAVGVPLASLVTACTAMGRFEEVAEWLDQPVPETMFQTRYGLHYLHARGRYSMATGHLPLALRDFQKCGELMTTWELDAPGLVAWRTDAAEALLRMGRPDQARRLIEDQLGRCGKDMPRVHGSALRLLAATSQLRHRPMLLRQAADLLQSGADRYEHSRVLVDLTEAYHALGESRRAGMIGRRARALAEECDAQPLLRRLSRDIGWDDKETAAAQPSVTGSAAMLSDAERRVAALAAIGYTNREISDKLYITVSTVEQHLTRIYRKLGVVGRTDLPAHLELDLSATV